MPWPDDFATFLRALQLLALDVSSISGFFCEFSGFDFNDGLLTATLVTLAVVVCLSVRIAVLTHTAKHAEMFKQRDKARKANKQKVSLKKALFYIGTQTRKMRVPAKGQPAHSHRTIAPRQASSCIQF